MNYLANVEFFAEVTRHARRRPNALAIVEGGFHMSYRALCDRVYAISQQLVSAGIGAGDHVGVYGDRSGQTICSLFALLNIGAVYVPLNPELPESRIDRYVKLAELKVVIICSAREAAMKSFSVPTVDVDQACCTELPIRCREDSAPAILGAYMIFTSGTTGEPKPVLVSRANLKCHCKAITSLFGLSRTDRVLHICATSFDIAIEEIVPTLSAGACVVVAPPLGDMAPADIQEFMQRSRITLANLPTALWCAWLDDLSRSGGLVPSTLRCVVVGGEPCPPERVRQWSVVSAGKVRCINGYGPTETTITATAWTFPPILRPSLRLVPVGTPLDGVHCHIVDDTLSPVQEGEQGELCISGELVSHGYFGSPSATAANFVPDPFGQKAGARMYRSGDNASRECSGELVVTGRRDRQVKVRGYRIELGEIEAALASHPGIARAFVYLSRKCATPRLLGVVQFKKRDASIPTRTYIAHDVSSWSSSLVAHISAILPRYMLPSHFCVIDEIPVNANGKVDYAKLPEFDLNPLEPFDLHLDEAVESCIRDTFGYMPVDINGSFLSLGGDSILAMQLASRLHHAGITVDVRDLLSPVPFADLLANAEQAELPRQNVADEDTSNIVGLEFTDWEIDRLALRNRSDIELVCACTGPQISMLYHSMLVSTSGMYIEQVEGTLDDLNIELFERAWREVCARHAILRASFSLILRDKPVQIVSKDVTVAINQANWSSEGGTAFAPRLGRFLEQDRSRGFDITCAPLFRLFLARVSETSHHFVWTYHHAILDGWSDLLVLDEVFSSYHALCRQELPRLAEPGRYRDFVHWLEQNDSTKGAVYWRRYLAGVTPGRTNLCKPTERIRGGEIRQKHVLTRAATQSLYDFARDSAVTLNTLCCAMCGWALASHFAVGEAVIGTISTLRPSCISHIERLAGPLLNLLPVRIPIPAHGSVRDWLRALFAAQVGREGATHTPYGLIAQAAPGGTMESLFDTMLVFENYPQPKETQAARMVSHTLTSYPLNFVICPGEELEVVVRYRPILVEEAAIQRIVSQFLAGLEALPTCSEMSDMPACPSKAAEDDRKVVNFAV